MARIGKYVQCHHCLNFWLYDKTKMFVKDGYEMVNCPRCQWDNCLKKV